MRLRVMLGVDLLPLRLVDASNSLMKERSRVWPPQQRRVSVAAAATAALGAASSGSQHAAAPTAAATEPAEGGGGVPAGLPAVGLFEGSLLHAAAMPALSGWDAVVCVEARCLLSRAAHGCHRSECAVCAWRHAMAAMLRYSELSSGFSSGPAILHAAYQCLVFRSLRCCGLSLLRLGLLDRRFSLLRPHRGCFGVCRLACHWGCASQNLLQ